MSLLAHIGPVPVEEMLALAPALAGALLIAGNRLRRRATSSSGSSGSRSSS